MSEQKLQAKIITWLQDNGFYTVKVVVATKKGVPDIVGCTPTGKFFAIEVKFGSNKLSKLQEYNLRVIKENGGISLVAYSLDDVTSVLGGYQTTK